MNESGPVRKTVKDPGAETGFCDFVRIASNVWRASRGGRYWLIKTAKDNDSASEQLLRREYEISCGLQHPFIVSTFNFEEHTDKGPAIVMEYISGRTLREFVSESPSAQKRKKVLVQIMDAVEYLHRKGILHNDIKPENILVTEIGDDVQIIDFGLSERDADFISKRLGGTPGASAPEVLEGDTSSPSTGSSDIYSLGGIIGLLFPGRYAGVVRKCHRNRPEARYKDVSSLRQAIVRRDRLPMAVLSVSVVCGLTALAIVPDAVRARNAQIEKDRRTARIEQIRSDLTVYYQAAADSLGNRELVPYQEFAYITRNNFVNSFDEYKNSVEQEMRPVCDSVYERLLTNLSKMMMDIPRFNEQKLPRDEMTWYHKLVMAYKPYSPFKKK